MPEFDREMQNLNLTRDEIFRPQIDTEDILALQAVAMGVVYKCARTRQHNAANNQHVFALYDRSEELTDESHMFLSGLVRRVDYDQWRMRISLLHWDLRAEARQKSTREDYHFDWLKNGHCQAWYALTKRAVLAGGHLAEFTAPRMPIERIDCDVLAEQMLCVVDRNPVARSTSY